MPSQDRFCMIKTMSHLRVLGIIPSYKPSVGTGGSSILQCSQTPYNCTQFILFCAKTPLKRVLLTLEQWMNNQRITHTV